MQKYICRSGVPVSLQAKWRIGIKKLLQVLVCRSSFILNEDSDFFFSHRHGRDDFHVLFGCSNICHHCCSCIRHRVCCHVCILNIFCRRYCNFCCRYSTDHHICILVDHHYNIEVRGNLHLILHIVSYENSRFLIGQVCPGFHSIFHCGQRYTRLVECRSTCYTQGNRLVVFVLCNREPEPRMELYDYVLKLLLAYSS